MGAAVSMLARRTSRCSSASRGRRSACSRSRTSGGGSRPHGRDGRRADGDREGARRRLSLVIVALGSSIPSRLRCSASTFPRSARGSSPSAGACCPDSIDRPRLVRLVDSGELAAGGAVRALGAALLLLARGRLMILGGLALVAVGRARARATTSRHGNRISPKLAALGRCGARADGDRRGDPRPLAGARHAARRVAAAVPAAALLRQRAPLLRRSRELGAARPPLAALRACSAPRRSRSAGSACRGRMNRPVPCDRLDPGDRVLRRRRAVAALDRATWPRRRERARLLPAPVRGARRGRRARAVPDLAAARARRDRRRRSRRSSPSSGSSRRRRTSSGSSRPSVEVGNAYSSFFRVTSLFRDPSLYGRHVVLGIAVLLVAVLYGRVSPFLAAARSIVVLFAGLWFSYSQSSMAALFVVTLALAAVAGDRALRSRRGRSPRRRRARRRRLGIVALGRRPLLEAASRATAHGASS